MADAKPKGLTRAYLSPAENLGVGVVGGCLETSLQMPLLSWKWSIQEGRPLPSSLGGYYRGVFAQAGSVAPITAVQVVTNGVLEKLVSGGTRDMTDGEKLGCAVGAGALSAIIYTPVDLVSIQQQKLSQGIGSTVSHIRQTYGNAVFFRGFTACVGREGLYSCGYLGMTPVSAKWIKENKLLEGDLACTLGGSVISGVVSAVLSHPFDTCKTIIQADVGGQKYSGAMDACRKLVQERGVRALYLGGLPRMIRNIGAFFVVGILRDRVITWKTERQGLTHKA